MELKRKFDLSLFYWLVDNVPSVVNVEDGFPNEPLQLSTVSVINLDVEGKPFELGGCELDTQFWRIDIFAGNKVQRDYLANTLYDTLESNITVYDYDEGFPPTVSPSEIGTLITSGRRMRPIRVFEELVEKLYWRTSLTFSTYYQSS